MVLNLVVKVQRKFQLAGRGAGPRWHALLFLVEEEEEGVGGKGGAEVRSVRRDL